MPFTPHEREALLSARFVGPTVVQRLEEIGFGDMSSLAAASVDEIVDRAAAHLGSYCWKNSPQSRTAIANAIAVAHEQLG